VNENFSPSRIANRLCFPVPPNRPATTACPFGAPDTIKRKCKSLGHVYKGLV
jgi:hypothetical protein